MAGGLIQIVTYGSQDLYLTGTPEITFFKIVYRRHTNFSIESVEVHFDDNVDFGEESTLTVPKIADLINFVILKITLPKLSFKKTPNSDSAIQTALSEWNTAITNYNTVQDYVEVMIEAFRRANNDYLATNVTTSGELYNSIETYFTDGLGFQTEIDNYKNILGNTFNENKTNLRTIADDYSPINTVNNLSSKITLYNKTEAAIEQCKIIQKYYYYQTVSKEEDYNDIKNDNVKMAWVKKLGHAMIEYTEVLIGGHKIDKQYGDWINVWLELSCDANIEKMYGKLIGNVPALTTFDRNDKPSCTLHIPLRFWFCFNNGLAIPLISLQYHDLSFNVKFRNFVDCAYMEKDKTILIPGYDDELYLDELGRAEGVIIQASMLIDYVYLDSSERKRFAQSSHEYLIEQVQMREFSGINLVNFQALIDFNHPCKELIWVAQKTHYVQNTDGYTECLWHVYSSNETEITTTNKYTNKVSTHKEYSGNPIKFTEIDFNGYVRVEKRDSTYFNYLQPYIVHNRSPADGVNCYSFALHPEKHQPSGQCNMSRLAHVIMKLDFDKAIFDTAPDKSSVLNLRIYTKNYNILRFISGMAGCAYTV
jgi:hypothetical protein